MFMAAAWLAVVNPTPAQLSEPMLECVEVKDGDITDGTYRGIPVQNPDEPLVMPGAEAAKAEQKPAPPMSERVKEMVAMKIDDLRPIAEALGIAVPKVGAKKAEIAAQIEAAEIAKAEQEAAQNPAE